NLVKEQAVNSAFEEASKSGMRGIIGISSSPLVSIDYKKDPHSSTIDGLSTSTSGNMIRVLAWYDNERAYSKRLIDTARMMCGTRIEPAIPSILSRAKN